MFKYFTVLNDVLSFFLALLVLLTLAPHSHGQTPEESSPPPRAVVVDPVSPVTEEAEEEGEGEVMEVEEIQAVPIENQEIQQPSPRAVVVQEGAVRDYEEWMLAGKTGKDGNPVDPNKPVRLLILSPRDGEVIDSTRVDLFFDVENYLLAEGGNRIHIVVDNQSPVICHDITRPFSLKSLSEGGHCIRAFLVKPDGVSIRQETAFAMVHFYVKRKDFQNYTDPTLPFVTINLPSDGQIEADSEDRICFDYWIHNVDKKDLKKFKLRYLLDKHEGYLSEQGPVYWSNLSAGKHRLVVELFDENKKPLFGIFNRIEREFEVKRVLKAKPVVEETDLMEEMIMESQ